MSGSVTESEACASEFDESWTPQQGQLQENYNFQWEPPWKNLDITIRLANGTTSEHTSFLLVPIKMQFLMKHSLSKIQQIIHSTKCCQVDSINSSKEHLEIKVNSPAADEIFNEVENYLVNEVDEVLLKPIQRFPYTSKLAEEYFKKGLKERSIDMLCDDSKIYIVGHSEQKDYINKGIEEIKRVTVTKILKIDEKWKIEAIKAFAFIDKLTGTFPDILARIQPGHSSIVLQGKDVTIKKAENEMKKLLSDLFNQKIQLDPLVLQLLTCKQASEMLTCILEKDRIQVVWTIDKTQLCFFSKFIINVDVLKSVLHEHFLTAGFSNSSQQSNKFCLSNAFLEITKMNDDKLLVFETTRSGINIAATKQIILQLLHREKLFYTDSRNTRGVQVDEVSCEIQTISRENKEIKKKAEGMELKCKKSEDRCKTLEIELKSEEEKAIRLAFEKQVTENTSSDIKAETTKQLKELRDLCGEHNNKHISQKIEIDRLRTTNQKLSDNLKTVNEELRSQVSTLEVVRRYFEDELKKIGKNIFEVQTDIYHQPFSDDTTRFLQKTSSKAVVSIKAKTNTYLSIYLAANIQRIKNLRKDSGVEVINDDEGGITLTGDLCSIISARDILLKWTNQSTDEDKIDNLEHADEGAGTILKYCKDDDSLMMETNEGVRVFVYKADICYLDNVDCIINSSNSEMNHSRGLSEVISKRAGKPMEDECKSYLRTHGTLSSDSICITSAGYLSHYKRIVHVNAPNAKLNLKPEEFSAALSSSVNNCLNQANNERMTSCAFPAVSSGHGGIPKDSCYSSYPTGVIEFSRKSKKPTVREVHFVARNPDDVALMQAAFLNAVREENEPSKGWKDKLLKIPQKTKDLFKSNSRDESQTGKYLELHLENRTVVIVCDGGLLNSLKHPHVKSVTSSLGFGQWNRQETVLVIPEDVKFSGESQTCQKCLKRGDKMFGQNYNSVKKVHRKNIGSVLETFAGYDMDFDNVLFPILPTFSDSAKVKNSSEETAFFEILYQSFLKILLTADKRYFKHLSTPLFCADFYNNSDEWFMVRSLRDMISAVKKFAISRQRKDFIVIHIATEGNDKLFQILNKEMSGTTL